MSKALQLCKEWIEDDEGRPLDSILEIEDKANAMGKKAWNEDFIAMCRAVKAELAHVPEVAPTKQPPTILEINSEARSTCQEFELDSEGDLCVSHKDKCDQGAEINFWLLKDDVQHLRDWLNRHAAFSPQKTILEPSALPPKTDPRWQKSGDTWCIALTEEEYWAMHAIPTHNKEPQS